MTSVVAQAPSSTSPSPAPSSSTPPAKPPKPASISVSKTAPTTPSPLSIENRPDSLVLTAARGVPTTSLPEAENPFEDPDAIVAAVPSGAAAPAAGVKKEEEEAVLPTPPASGTSTPPKSALKQSNSGLLKNAAGAVKAGMKASEIEKLRKVNFWQWVDVGFSHSSDDYDRNPIDPEPLTKEGAMEVIAMRMEMRRITQDLYRWREEYERTTGSLFLTPSTPTNDEEESSENNVEPQPASAATSTTPSSTSAPTVPPLKPKRSASIASAPARSSTIVSSFQKRFPPMHPPVQSPPPPRNPQYPHPQYPNQMVPSAAAAAATSKSGPKSAPVLGMNPELPEVPPAPASTPRFSFGRNRSASQGSILSVESTAAEEAGVENAVRPHSHHDSPGGVARGLVPTSVFLNPRWSWNEAVARQHSGFGGRGGANGAAAGTGRKGSVGQ
ncbi:hypothetical protein HDU97_004793 [Phlyctochytrium planicorne]|nr:hypothetical protein HDU97_004793 [Phlyctochytrium planicorne]